MKESLNPPGTPPPLGPYVNVTIAPPGGRLVFCAGTVAFGPDGEIVGEGDIVAQTRQVMENLRIALEAAGATFADVVKIVNYVTDVTEYPKIAPVRAEYLKEPYPVSTMVEVSGLMVPELLIEIEATAVVHDD
ncbi:MAG: 2-iminobutanoate/2-iminopropanoate deaminase [Solirubrobacteraceae bacterium]|jgi:2-iminobutanoate/2-iminopropanoate deaminase|nr:2-iminobutanoate/2-iminopropanoate deaminase [Solirubrobacteraceae bacterium]MEA2246450.1 2-iminobutanoate/2-iminopropanoate deaminase [Solirubrobacteraceae bacterium]